MHSPYRTGHYQIFEASMKPKYYQVCLWLTIVECAVAFTIALALWVNLMPLWIHMPDAENLSDFEKYMTSGYGFWGAMWAIPNYVMLQTTDLVARRKWALLAGCMYLLWWVFWWDQIWNGTWHWYVLVGYLPLRLFQAVANLTYALRTAPV